MLHLLNMRKIPFINGEFYHIYNRGVDKRNIFEDQKDIDRFFQSMNEFNSVEPIGSIYEKFFAEKKFGCPAPKTAKLVNFVCYCLNPNHYHFILEQVADGGISEFMKRLGGGYTNYFNEKHKRSGALFQGRFKSIHVSSNEYLLWVGVYVNLNDRVHQLTKQATHRIQSKSSWREYIGENEEDFCTKDIILGQFDTKEEYRKVAEETLDGILDRRYDVNDIEKYFLE